MRVVDILFAPGMGAFYYDDQAAIRAGVAPDGFLYNGDPVTPGFRSIRVPAESLGVGLELDDGAVVWGDMMGVQYSGSRGRDPLFDTHRALAMTAEALAPRLIGLELRCFREDSAAVLKPTEARERLPVAIQYGVSQALLRATRR